MAILKFKPNNSLPEYDMVQARLDFPDLLNNYDKYVFTETQVKMENSLSDRTFFYGADIAWSTNSNGKVVFSDGTFSEIEIRSGSQNDLIKITELNLDVGDFGALLSRGSVKLYDLIFEGNDTISGAKGNDRLKGFDGDDRLNGLDGNDRLYGDRGKDKLYGNDDNDKLFGGDGSDTLIGGEGNDTLYGEEGKDTLTGGSGDDKFVFNTALGAANRDVVTDFNVTDDRIHVENAIFRGIANGTLAASRFASNNSGNAQDDSDRIIYEEDTGKLFYDRDGTGGTHNKVHFATLDDDLPLTHSDFFIL